MSEIRVFLVDDHVVVCQGLRQMLEEDDIRVIGEAQSGEEALVRLEDDPADVVLLDVRLGGMDGIETLRKLKHSNSDLKVIMLTSYGDEYLTAALEAGASGYLLKRANATEMVKAIREAFLGGMPLDSQVPPGLINRLTNPFDSGATPLSGRQIEVLELAAAGMSNKEIAETLIVAEATVKNHMTSIRDKLDANDRTHAVTIALSGGWISNPV